MKKSTQLAFDSFRKQVPRKERYRYAGKNLKLNVYRAFQANQYLSLICAIVNVSLGGAPAITVALGVAAVFLFLLRYFSLSMQRPWFWMSAVVEVGIPLVIAGYFIPEGSPSIHFVGFALFALAFRCNVKAERYVDADAFEAFIDYEEGADGINEQVLGDCSAPSAKLQRWDDGKFQEMLQKPADEFTADDILQLENADKLLDFEEHAFSSVLRPRFTMAAGSERKGVEMSDKMHSELIEERRIRAKELLNAAREFRRSSE